jgi:VanZ family protein
MLPPRYSFDDRSPAGARIGLPIKPPVLRRSTLCVMAALVVAGALYGALAPFKFDFRGQATWRLPLLPLQPGDALANILVYIPVGLLLRLVVRSRGSRWPVECIVALLLALAISYGAEFFQQWLPTRVATLTDTLCNVFGAGTGVLIAPLAQRQLRACHAWFFGNMQTMPFKAAAGLLTIVVCICALMPFDIQLTASHVWASLGRLQTSLQASLLSSGRLSPPAVLSKWMAAGAWGALAFVLTLSAREGGRSNSSSAYHGLTRSCCLAACIEMLQLFTISHVADCQDLARAWLLCGVGTSAGAILLFFRPLIHRDPAAIAGPLATSLCFVVAGWFIFSALHSLSGAENGRFEWLPVMGNFHRSWNGLLADYASWFISYILAISTFVWCLRLRGQVPQFVHCLAAGLIGAVSVQVLAAVFFGRFPDTAHFAMAIPAAALVHRFELALRGRIGSQPVS